MKNRKGVSSFRKIHSVTIVANQTTQANVRANKYFKEATITVKVVDAFNAKQTGVKKITVTGSDLTDVVSDYVLKRGTVTIDIDTVTLNEEKNNAVITSKASRLTAGEYTLQFKDREPLALTVEEGKVTKIDIPSDTLPLNGEYNEATGAIVAYVVYNQFNEDVTKTVSTINATSSFGKAEAKSNNSTIEIDFEGVNKPLIGATGTIILVDTATGINFNKTMTLGMMAKADTIDILGVYNSVTGEKYELKESSTNANAALLVKVSDQYGGPMVKLDCANEVAFTFTGGITNLSVADTKAVYEETISVDGATYVVIPLVATNLKAGTAQAFFVSTSTGKTATITITVGANATVKTIDVYPKDTVYGGGVENEFGYTALTEDGTEVTDYDTLSNNAYGITQMSCNYGDFNWKKNNDGTAKLVFKSNTTFENAIGTSKSLMTSATFVTAGYGTKTITFNIQAKAVPTSVGGTKNITLGILAAADGSTENSVTFTPASHLVIYDQYGNAMNSGFENYFVKIEPQGTAATASEITMTTGSAVEGDIVKLSGDNQNIIFKATSSTSIDKAYTERYKVTLLNPGKQEVDTAGYMLSVSAAPMFTLTRFELNKVADLYAFDDATFNATHITEPKVVGYTSANVAITIPNSKLTLTPGFGLTVATDAAIGGGGTKCFSASGAAAYITADDTKAVTRETELTVVVDNGQAQGNTFTQKVNVSTISPQAKTVGANSSISVSQSAVNMNQIFGKLTYSVKDQYDKVYGSGKYGSLSISDAKNIQISNISKGTTSTLAVTKNNTAEASITGSAAIGDNFVITVTLKSGTVITSVVTVIAD